MGQTNVGVTKNSQVIDYVNTYFPRMEYFVHSLRNNLTIPLRYLSKPKIIENLSTDSLSSHQEIRTRLGLLEQFLHKIPDGLPPEFSENDFFELAGSYVISQMLPIKDSLKKIAKEGIFSDDNKNACFSLTVENLINTTINLREITRQPEIFKGLTSTYEYSCHSQQMPMKPPSEFKRLLNVISPRETTNMKNVSNYDA